jgi:hypothetical protein
MLPLNGTDVHSGMSKIGSRAAAVVVLGAIALALCSCASTKPTPEQTIQEASQDLRQAVSGNVADPARRDQMLALVDQIAATQRSFSMQAAEFAAQYSRMNADYDAPRARFEQLFADFNAQRVQSRDRILDLHFQLAALATEQEWRPIGKAEAKLYKNTQQARAEQAAGA